MFILNFFVVHLAGGGWLAMSHNPPNCAQNLVRLGKAAAVKVAVMK